VLPPADVEEEEEEEEAEPPAAAPRRMQFFKQAADDIPEEEEEPDAGGDSQSMEALKRHFANSQNDDFDIDGLAKGLGIDSGSPSDGED
jgi:hypothetical protein